MIGRNTELQQLGQLYQQEGSQAVVLYGRKEQGIRRLAQAFCSGKPSFYYFAPETSAQAQRKRLGRDFALDLSVTAQDGFYDALFQGMGREDGGKLVWVVDEFQNIVKKDPSFWGSLL